MHAGTILPILVCTLVAAGVSAEQAAPRPGGRVHPPAPSYIGLGIVEVGEEAARKIGLVEPHGVEISSVAEDSPAEAAGLRVGDVVLAYRGEPVHGIEHFARLVRETPVGREVSLHIARDSRRSTVQVKIGLREARSLQFDLDARREHFDSAKERMDSIKGRLDALKHEFERGWPHDGLRTLRLFPALPQVHMVHRDRLLGVELEGIEGQLARYFGVHRGVLVRSVADGSPAAEAGLRAGDVIVSVKGRAVAQGGEVGRALRRSASGRVELAVMRDRQKHIVELEAPPGPTPRAQAPRPVSAPI